MAARRVAACFGVAGVLLLTCVIVQVLRPRGGKSSPGRGRFRAMSAGQGEVWAKERHGGEPAQGRA